MCAASLGLSRDESKGLLANLQKELVVSQFEHFVQNQRICSQCGTRRAIKDYHSACFKSLFGGVALRVPRRNKCACDSECAGVKTVKINKVRLARNPTAALLEFLYSTYVAAAELGDWDRDHLECAVGEPQRLRPPFNQK